MQRFVIRRLISSIPVIILVSMLTFVGLEFLPGDPILALVGENSESLESIDGDTLDVLRRNYGLDQPMPVRYAKYVSRVLQGDFGRSLVTNEPVTKMIGDRLPVTLWLNAVTFTANVLSGILLGVLAGVYAGRKIDLIATTIAVLGVATPGFWLAILLIIVFSLTLGWLPPAGWVSPVDDPVRSMKHMALPVLSLGLLGSASIMRQTRSSVREALQQDYVRTAQAKGLTAFRVMSRHVLKNAMLPVVTILGLQIAGLVTGSVLIERVFGLPGVGRLAVEATTRRDYPVLQAIVLMSASAIIVANFIADLAYGWLDPRIRYE